MQNYPTHVPKHFTPPLNKVNKTLYLIISQNIYHNEIGGITPLG